MPSLRVSKGFLRLADNRLNEQLAHEAPVVTTRVHGVLFVEGEDCLLQVRMPLDELDDGSGKLLLCEFLVVFDVTEQLCMPLSSFDTFTVLHVLHRVWLAHVGARLALRSQVRKLFHQGGDLSLTSKEVCLNFLESVERDHRIYGAN